MCVVGYVYAVCSCHLLQAGLQVLQQFRIHQVRIAWQRGVQAEIDKLEFVEVVLSEQFHGTGGKQEKLISLPPRARVVCMPGIVTRGHANKAVVTTTGGWWALISHPASAASLSAERSFAGCR